MIADILTTMDSKPRMVELGKIKIGGLGAAKAGRNGAYRVPRKDDHFHITTLQRGPDKDGARGDLINDAPLMTALLEEWGDEGGKLRAIPIRVLSDDIEDILQSAYVWYQGRVCRARSDGKTLTWYFDDKNVKYEPPFEEPHRAEILDWANGDAKLFKLHSVLNCVIASHESRWGGIYKMRTTSIISFQQLYASLVHIAQLTGGVLTNMPLMLRVRPMQVAPKGKATTVHVVHVELMGADMLKIREQALLQAEYATKFHQQLLATRRQYKALLVGPGQEMNGEAADINEEFAPESTELGAPPAPTNGYSLLDDDSNQDRAPATPAANPAQSVPDAPVPSAPAAEADATIVDDDRQADTESGGAESEHVADEQVDDGATPEPVLSNEDAQVAPVEPEVKPLAIPTLNPSTWDLLRSSAKDYYFIKHKIAPNKTAEAMFMASKASNFALKDQKNKKDRVALAAAMIEDRFDIETGTIRA